jgi:hypothetical protein
MNNEYPQDAQPYNPAPPAQAPVPPVVDAPAAEPYYQAPTTQGYPAQNYPNQGYGNQGYPAQNYPNQGYPNQGYPNQNPYAPPAGYYAQPNYYAPAAEEQPGGVWKVFAILGLVFGIIGLALCWVPMVDIFTTAMAIFGIVFSALGKKSRSGAATAGLVLSIIGTVLGFIFAVAFGEALMLF